eukprot:c1796_g1_i1.p2 GENE.c1796_g1_i1~~c1796_g1_i1.p2  ORF type:complete len:123 (-),score=27.34 c1796_g1_i1:68-436(-)
MGNRKKPQMKAFCLLALFAFVAVCQAAELKAPEDVAFLEAEPSQPSQPAQPFFPFMGMGGMGMMGGMGGMGMGAPMMGGMFGGNMMMMGGAYFMDPFLFNAFFTPNAMVTNTMHVLNAGKTN